MNNMGTKFGEVFMIVHTEVLGDCEEWQKEQRSHSVTECQIELGADKLMNIEKSCMNFT